MITTTEGHKYKVVMKWKELKSDGCFRFNRKKFSIEDFDPMLYPEAYERKDGKLCHLYGYEKNEYVHPLILEWDENNMVRLLQDIGSHEG